MKTLQEIIAKDGDETVAKKLGFSEVYMRHIRTGVRRPSSNVLRLAQAVYGRRLNVAASLLADVKAAA